MSLCITSPRQWYWNGIHRRWRLRTTLERGFGRHCEVVIAAHRLANPQWTPFREDAQPWMTLGFALFAGLAETTTYEVFPSASYTLLEDDASILTGLSLLGFSRGPKDMLDAYAAALTIREFERGLGTAVGDGDSLGQIILPRKIKNPITPVLNWPSERMDA
jgi:hypothetical protein